MIFERPLPIRLAILQVTGGGFGFLQPILKMSSDFPTPTSSSTYSYLARPS